MTEDSRTAREKNCCEDNSHHWDETHHRGYNRRIIKSERPEIQVQRNKNEIPTPTLAAIFHAAGIVTYSVKYNGKNTIAANG